MVLLVSSCANYEKIEVNDVSIESIKLGAKTTVVLNIEVNNPTGQKFRVKSFEGELLRNGKPFADVLLVNEPVVPARTVTDVPVNLEVVLRNPFDALSMGINLKSLDINQFTVNAKGVVKGGLARPKVDVKGIPLKSVVQYFK